MTQREQVAIHEAGHAVCATLLGKPYGAALHANGGGLAGPGDLSEPAKAENYTVERMEKAYEDDPLSDVLRDMVITAGGTVAVAVAALDPLVIPSGGDRNMLTAAVRSAFPDADFEVERAAVALAVARARVLLTNDWPRVERVAAALAESGHLTAAEVEAVYTKTQGETE